MQNAINIPTGEIKTFGAYGRDIRAFRIEQWSDFTPVIKS